MVEAINRGETPTYLRLHMSRLLPQSIRREVEQHPRFRAILKQFDIDDAWRDELMEMTNKLTDVTGIHVRLDEAY